MTGFARSSARGGANPPVSRKLRQWLGNVTKFVGKEQEQLETNPQVFAIHIEVLEKSIAVLTEVLRMQH